MVKAMFNPENHHRRSIRLKGCDYSQLGAYSITLCVQDKIHLFGNVTAGQMRLNDAGKMVEQTWNQIPQFYADFAVDVFQVMPNHFHGILKIVGAGPRACPEIPFASETPCGYPNPLPTRMAGRPRGVAPTVGDIIGRFKTMTTKRYTDGVKYHHWPPFKSKLWQRNYYEHIVRNDFDYTSICEYIFANPDNWESDDLFGGPSKED